MTKLPEEVASGKRYPTTREVASFVMILFDPLGFITPLKIQGLFLFQETWKKVEKEIGWNDEILTSLYLQWKKWIEEPSQLLTYSLKIPRCVRITANHGGTYQLHIYLPLPPIFGQTKDGP